MCYRVLEAILPYDYHRMSKLPLASHMAKKNGKFWNMCKKRGEKRRNGGHIQQKCRKRMPARQAGTGVSGKGGMVLHHDLPETAALPHRSQALREKRRTQIRSVARQQRPSVCRLLLFRGAEAGPACAEKGLVFPSGNHGICRPDAQKTGFRQPESRHGTSPEPGKAAGKAGRCLND